MYDASVWSYGLCYYSRQRPPRAIARRTNAAISSSVAAAGSLDCRRGRRTALPIAIATGDPDPGGLPPVFTAICLVVTPTGRGTGFFVGERANVVTARYVVCKDKPDNPADDPARNTDRRAQNPRDAAQDGPPPIVVCWVSTGRGFLFNAPAEIVREDPRTDVALLRLKNPEEFPRPLTLDSVTSLSPKPARPGDFVYFDTFQRMPSQEFQIRRVQARVKQSYSVRDHSLEQRVLALDAKAWPGSSGSPVFSTSGEVIGILTGSHAESDEALVRDGCWLWELFGNMHPGTRRKSAAAVIPFPWFPPPSFAPYGDAHPAGWRSWLQRVGARLFPQLKTSGSGLNQNAAVPERKGNA
jgi:Trypsin-like peptidase domain